MKRLVEAFAPYCSHPCSLGFEDHRSYDLRIVLRGTNALTARFIETASFDPELLISYSSPPPLGIDAANNNSREPARTIVERHLTRFLSSFSRFLRGVYARAAADSN